MTNLKTKSQRLSSLRRLWLQSRRMANRLPQIKLLATRCSAAKHVVLHRRMLWKFRQRSLSTKKCFTSNDIRMVWRDGLEKKVTSMGRRERRGKSSRVTRAKEGYRVTWTIFE